MGNRHTIDIETVVGKKFNTDEGYIIEIIEYFRYTNCTIKFNTDLILTNVSLQAIKGGYVKNPYHKTVYGIGYFGVGKYTSIGVKGDKNKKKCLSYSKWQGMLFRCYSESGQLKYPTYKNVTVCKEWHNYQNFAKWFEENYKPHMAGWHLEKDILTKGNKIYSPETCCFVPIEINSLIIGCDKSRGNYPIGVYLHKLGIKFVASLRMYNKTIYLGYFDTIEEAFETYKIAKEIHIKEIADKYKGQITEACYEAMYNYKVEIDD